MKDFMHNFSHGIDLRKSPHNWVGKKQKRLKYFWFQIVFGKETLGSKCFGPKIIHFE